MSPDVLFRLCLFAFMFGACTAGWRNRRRGDVAGTVYWMLVWATCIIVALDLP